MESKTKTVTMIPPTIPFHQSNQISTSVKRRVAAYARVSTDNEEQLSSYEAQVEYYTKYINEHSDWAFAGVYSDEGITGTCIKKRKGFQRMINDAMDGKIDLIITKSISRFARNTVDSISTVRQLKEKGVEVYFEKDGLWTFDPSAELTITILSSIAQEESRNLSENVKWGHRTRYAEGKVTMPYKRFLGYDRGENGQPVINEKQAELVRRIFAMFIKGMTPSGIAKQLTAENIPTPGGRHIWQASVVESILTNEKYKGDALLQKTFCIDYLTKKMKANEGEVPQYYVEGSHPPIISPELFDYVQHEIQQRKGVKCIAGAGCFAGKIVCGCCGSFYGPKVWHSNSKYRRKVWRCNKKYENGQKCSTPHLYEDKLKKIFIDVINKIIIEKDQYISDYTEIIKTLTDNSKLREEQKSLENECEVLFGMMKKMISENSHKAQNQEEYVKHYNDLAQQYNMEKAQLVELEKIIQVQNVKRKELECFLKMLKKQENLLSEFDEGLWLATVRQVTVKSENEYLFEFKDGQKLMSTE